MQGQSPAMSVSAGTDPGCFMSAGMSAGTDPGTTNASILLRDVAIDFMGAGTVPGCFMRELEFAGGDRPRDKHPVQPLPAFPCATSRSIS